MDRLPYSRLSEFYDVGWGDFAESGTQFVAATLQEYGLKTGNILEVACGTDILAIHLARAGYAVLGIDRSPEMIALAVAKGRRLDNAVFRVADIRTFALEARFDAAIWMFDSINYLTTLEDMEAAIGSISAALNRGSPFIFDFNRPLIYSAYSGKTVKRRVEGGLLLQELTYEASQGIAKTVFRFPDGDTETHIQRAYELDEIEPLLVSANLHLQAAFSDFSRRAQSTVSERLICVCRKN